MKNYQSHRHNWNLAEALVGVAAIYCIKEIFVQGLNLFALSINKTKEEKK